MPSVVSCARCGSCKTLKYAPAFNRDGTATFRHLCARCARYEWSLNQPSLPGLTTRPAPGSEAIELLEIRIRHHEGLAAGGDSYSAVYVEELRQELAALLASVYVETEPEQEPIFQPVNPLQMALFGPEV